MKSKLLINPLMFSCLLKNIDCGISKQKLETITILFWFFNLVHVPHQRRMKRVKVTYNNLSGF